MKYGEMYPLSNFNPSMTSNSSSKVLPSFTVMTPSLPTYYSENKFLLKFQPFNLILLYFKSTITFSMASEMSFPILASPFAEIVATCAISSADCTFLDKEPKCALTVSTANMTPNNQIS